MGDRSVNIRLSLKDGELVKRGLQALGDEGAAALKRLEAGGEPASRALRAVDEASKEAQASIRSWAEEAGAAGRVLIAFGPWGIAAAAGIGAVIFAGVKLVDAAKEAATELQHLQATSDRLGVNPEFLQGIRFAAGQLGADVEKVDSSLDQLNRHLGDVARGAEDSASKAFKRLGFSVFDAEGHVKGLQQALPGLADGFQKLSSAQERASVAQEIFGRGNQAFGRTLAEGSEGLQRSITLAREMGAVIEEGVVRRGAEAHDKLEALSTVIKAQLTTAVLNATPAIIAITTELAKFAKVIGELVDAHQPLERQLSSTLAGTLNKLREEQAALIEEQKGVVAQFDPFGHDADLTDVLKRRQANMAEILRIEALLRGRRDQITPIVPGAPPPLDLKPKDTAGENAAKRIAQTESDVRAQQDLIAAQIKAGQTYDALIRSGVARADALRAETDELRAAQTQEEIHNRLKTAGVKADSEAGRTVAAEVTEMERLKFAQEDANKARQQGASVTAAAETAAEKYRQSLADLNYLLGRGAITQETYNRSIVDLAEKIPEIAATKDAFTSLFSELNSNLQQGQNFWDAFANAGISALDRLEAKLLDIVTNRLFDELLGDLFKTPTGAFTGLGPLVLPGAPPVGTQSPVGIGASVTAVHVTNNLGSEAAVDVGPTGPSGNVEMTIRRITRDELADRRGQKVMRQVYDSRTPVMRRR
jgi:TP901 family phage tail tape measure protein